MNKLSQFSEDMPDINRTQNALTGGALASLLAALVVAALNYFMARFISDQLLVSFLASLVGFAVVLLAIKVGVINLFEIIGTKYLDAHTGIVKVYKSIDNASEDLKEAFRKAKRIDLLLHIGRREFGIRDALFYATMKERIRHETDLEIRILHIDEESPYLSEERAKQLGKRREKWLRDVQYVREQILESSGEAENVRLAMHRQPFIWRLFFFDDTVFVSAYLHRTKNDRLAPVFKIKDGSNSLYAAFKREFDYLWTVYSESNTNSDRHNERTKQFGIDIDP